MYLERTRKDVSPTSRLRSRPEMQLLFKIDLIPVLNLGQTVQEFELDTDKPPNFTQRLPMSNSAQNPPLSYRVSPKSPTLTPKCERQR